MATTGQVINVSDYNGIRTILDQAYGTNGLTGSGQSLVSQTKASGDVINASDINNLITDCNTIGSLKKIAVPALATDLVAVATGDIITAAKINEITTRANLLYTNRLVWDISPAGLSTTNSNSSTQFSVGWELRRSFTWSSEAALNWWANSGSYILTYFSFVKNVTTPQEDSWLNISNNANQKIYHFRALCRNLGGTTVSTSGIANLVVGSGWQNLATVYSTSTNYTTNYVLVQHAKISATQYDVRYLLYDNHVARTGNWVPGSANTPPLTPTGTWTGSDVANTSTNTVYMYTTLYYQNNANLNVTGYNPTVAQVTNATL